MHSRCQERRQRCIERLPRRDQPVVDAVADAGGADPAHETAHGTKVCRPQRLRIGQQLHVRGFKVLEEGVALKRKRQFVVIQHVEHNEILSPVAIRFEPHLELKKRVPGAVGLIRTADTTQYGNIIVESA